MKYIPSWFPGALFKRQAKEWRKLSEAMLQKPFEMVKQKMVRTQLSKDLASEHLLR